MGAQQTKYDEEFLNDYIQQNNANEREKTDNQHRLQEDEHEFINPLEDTVIPDQYHTLLPMNEIDAPNLFSGNSLRNTLTVAAFAKIKTETEDENNICIDPLQSCEIKRELLAEGSNQGIGNSVKEANINLESNGANLEANNNVEINSELNNECTNDLQVLTEHFNRELMLDNSATEIVSSKPNNIEKDKDLLNNNSSLDEIRDLAQSRDIKVELLESHGVPLENSEIHQQIDEPYIEQERNLSIDHGNKDSLHIEEFAKPIKSELIEANIDEHLNTINQESLSFISTTDLTIETESNLLNGNINKNTLNVQTKETNNASSLNTILTDTKQQSFQNNNSCENSVLNKDFKKDSVNIEQQPKEIFTESVELPINTKFELASNDPQQETNISHHRFLKENSNDPLIIKDESVELPINTKFELASNDPQQETNISHHRFLKENSNDPLIIKDLIEEIKAESTTTDVADENEIPEKVTQKCDFVKNPFAFLKKLYKNKGKTQKSTETTAQICTKKIKSPADVIIKSEIFIDSDGEEIEINGQFNKTIIKTENDISITKEKPQTLSTNDELIIKSESLTELFPIDSNLPSTTANNWNDVNVKAEQIEESFENYQLPFVDINDSDDLNISLDVNVDNLSTADSNIDELFFTQSNDDVLSNSTAITSPTSSEYHSILEISSLDDIEFLIPKSNINKDQNKLQENRRGRPVCSTDTKNKCNKGGPKPKSRLNSEDKTNKQNEKPKKKPKKSSKYTEKDSAFPISASCFKDIPKPTIVTRTKETTQISNTPKPTITKNSNKPALINEEFPKPFKLEMAGSTEKDIAIELPRPMLFKSESAASVNKINVNETSLHKTPEFQPYVRLKRLKSEELLIPYKIRKVYDRKNEYKKPTRHLRRSYPFVTKSTSTNMGLHQYSLPNLNQRELLIQNAYSLNPRVKLHRWSMDQDNPFVNHSQLTTSSYGMPSRLSDHRQSKYFTAEELHSLFQSPAPPEEETYSHSYHFDSGVSSSTPYTSHTSATTPVRNNKTLLLEIAAERAFINNHLLHFGFSPIHFELYNNVDDLNVFIKYLFGQLNNN